MSQFPRKVDLRIPSEFGYEKVAMETAAAVAQRMGFSDERVRDLRTALSEACLNAMEHGNQFATDTKVDVMLIVDDDRLEVSVWDEGRGDTSPQITAPLTLDNPPNKRHGNMGMFLITQLMDEVEFSREPQGSMVKMCIYLEQPVAEIAKFSPNQVMHTSH